MLSIPEDDGLVPASAPRKVTNNAVRKHSSALQPRTVSSNVSSTVSSKKLQVYREFEAGQKENTVDARDHDSSTTERKLVQRTSRRRRTPAATYGEWFEGDDAELEKMVDEFENELVENELENYEQQDNVGDRVRESVAELCGALDELIEDDHGKNENRQQNNPTLREQLLDSWQGKSYYERLQNMVVQDAGGDLHKVPVTKPKLGGSSANNTRALSSINLNVSGNAATNNIQKKKPSSISLLQPLYKNQNYMIPQKALDVSRATTPKATTADQTPTKAQLTNVLAELTKLAIPTKKEDLVTMRGDLMRIVEACQRKLIACAAAEKKLTDRVTR